MEMIDDDQSRYWAGLIAEREPSGLSVAEFCRDRGVSVHIYRAWRTRLNKQSSSNGGWIALEAEPPTETAKPMTVRVGVVSIDVSSGFDPHLLRDIVTALAQC